MMYFCSRTCHFRISQFQFCTFIIYLQWHTSQNIDYKDNNTACFDYCESIFVVGTNFVVSTKCIIPWVLEFVVSNTTGNNQWDNCISLDFNFLWFKWTTKWPKIRLQRLIMISQYSYIVCVQSSLDFKKKIFSDRLLFWSFNPLK